jgi:predicted regulator of Ras-like GTPase activity (Roadblock/LC7/MglB family)
MSFSEVLKGMTGELKGAKGALIVGMDGIIVDEYTAEPAGVDMSSIGAEYGNVLKEIQNASRSLQLGEASEVAVKTDAACLIMRKINEEYFVALLFSPDGNIGKGRFLVRSATRRLVKEF